MSVQISTGNKKKSYRSIREAAAVVANSTGEPFDRVYMRLYMRMRSGMKPVTAMRKKARKYTLN